MTNTPDREKIRANAATIDAEIDWFDQVLQARISLYFEQTCPWNDVREIQPPEIGQSPSEYAQLLRETSASFDERLLLILALLPYVRPQALDTLFLRNKNLDRYFTEFGGRWEQSYGGFVPTLETASFILNGSDLEGRFCFAKLFDEQHPFFQRGILQIDRRSDEEPCFNAVPRISNEHLARLTTGDELKPELNNKLLAKRITTEMHWNDLVLPSEAIEEIQQIQAWLQHGSSVMRDWKLCRADKPGFLCLFYGPLGTGKNLTAALLGKQSGLDVYRVDLSMVVSKYIGETELNLTRIFDQAKNKNWLLFFDNADAIFAKRTSSSSQNDHFPNQEVSYLLRRMEDHPGLVILAMSIKANVDSSLAQCFQSCVYFPNPDVEQRLQLWKHHLREESLISPNVDWKHIAENYELTGGAINKAVRYAALCALRHGRTAISQEDLMKGASKQLRWE